MNENYYANSIRIEKKQSIITFNDMPISVELINKFYVINETIISRIYYLHVDEHIVNIIEKGYFNDLQKEVLAEDFYSLKEDLRWNLYLILISNKDVFTSKRRSEILRDDNYARKFILSQIEFENFITPSLSIDNNDYDSSILNNWHNTLEKSNLAGCLYSECNKEKVKRFIEQDKAINPVGRKLKRIGKLKKLEALSINRINYLELKGYRTHCFDDYNKINLARVNLLCGTNGSGKTSICDAVETVLTGADKTAQDEQDLTIHYNDMHDMSSQINNDEKRLRDYNWYNSVVSGYNVPLRSHFESTNYFQSNIVNSNNLGNNINQFLERILFGDEFEMCRNFINNYTKEFSRQQKTLRKEKKEILNSLKDITINPVNKIEQFEIIRLINNLGFIHQDEHAGNFDDFYRIKAIKHDVEILSNFIAKHSLITKSEFEKLEYSSVSSKNIINESINKNKDTESKITENEKKVKSKNSSLINAIDEFDFMKQVFDTYESHSHTVSGISINDYIANYEKESKDVDRLKKIYEIFYNKYRIMPEVIETYDEYSIHSDIIENSKMLSKISDNIEKISSIGEEINGIIETLYSSMVNDDITFKSCPLCGSSFENEDALFSAINKSRKLDKDIKQDLETLYKRRQEYEKIDSDLNKLLSKIKVNEEFSLLMDSIIHGFSLHDYQYSHTDNSLKSRYAFIMETIEKISQRSSKLYEKKIFMKISSLSLGNMIKVNLMDLTKLTLRIITW